MALSQKGKSGQWEIQADKAGVTLLIDWSETYDSYLNASVFSIDKIQGKSSKYRGYSYFLDGHISVDGTAIASFSSAEQTNYLYWGNLNTYEDMQVQNGGTNVPFESERIAHSKEGLRTINVVISITGISTKSGIESGWVVSLSEDIELTPIYTGIQDLLSIPIATVFMLNGSVVFPIYSRKVVGITYRPGGDVDDSAVLGTGILGTMILGKGG